MSRYKVYPEYKDSGEEWIGKIPEHWKVKPAFAVMQEECIKNMDGLETNVLSLSYGRIIQRNVEDNFGLLPESFNTYQLVNCGDIVLRLTDLQNDKKSLRVGRSNQQGIITSAYLKLVCKEDLNSLYAYLLLHAYDTAKVFYGMGGGLRQSMKFEDFKRLPIIFPNEIDQKKIADFLDFETSKIDQLINKQKTLIELLKEKRQALISQAVTKGLNPHVKMKDSSIEWLGEVPEHWNIKPVKYLITTKKGVAFKSQDFINLGINVVRASDIKNNVIKASNIFLPESFCNKYPDAVLKEGDIILSTVGSNPNVVNSAVGQIGIVPSDLTGSLLNQNTVSFVINNTEIISKFLLYSLISKPYREHLNIHAHGTANQSSLNIEDMVIFKLPIPTLQEQHKITVYIETQTLKIDKLLERTTKAISLLQERRTALISAAVTGKIDVRDWQSPNAEGTLTNITPN